MALWNNPSSCPNGKPWWLTDPVRLSIQTGYDVDINLTWCWAYNMLQHGYNFNTLRHETWCRYSVWRRMMYDIHTMLILPGYESYQSIWVFTTFPLKPDPIYLFNDQRLINWINRINIITRMTRSIHNRRVFHGLVQDYTQNMANLSSTIWINL